MNPASNAHAGPARWMLVMLLAVWGCGPTAPDSAVAEGTGSSPTTRLVLISLDTLRADRFDAQRMPSLTAAAEQGLVFTNFHASTSVTLPTHVSMLSGLHPWEHGVLRNGVIVRDEVTLLAERLQERGFATAAVVASFPLERRFRVDQGFDVYVDDFEQQSSKTSWNQQNIPGSLFSSSADKVAAHATRLLDETVGAQQFFFFHFFDPHAPYGDSRTSASAPPLELSEVLKKARNQSPGLAKSIDRAEKLYDADVRFLDGVLGGLLARLARDAEQIETHILITADHGESFGEDGSLGHGKRVSPAQIRVPFVLLSPRVEAGVRSEVASSVDVATTLMAMADIAPDPSLAGRNLLDPAPSAARALGMRSLFDEVQQDVRMDGSALPVTELRFFLARADKHVTGSSSVGTTHEGVAPELDMEGGTLNASERAGIQRLFDGLAKEVHARMAEMVQSADPETRAALEALGYTR